MLVETGESDDGTQGYRRLKTDRRKVGSKVTGLFASKLVPWHPQGREEYEGGNYGQ